MNANLLVEVIRNEQASVLELLARGANPNCCDSRGITPLHRAARWGRNNHISLLLAHGANIDTVDSWDGRTPLALAAREGFADSVRILLTEGASVDSADLEGCTPLHHATAFNRVAVIDVLLAHGASPDVPNKAGTTPLHVAARGYHEVLMQAHKNQTQGAYDHLCTALDNARNAGRSTIFTALLKHSSLPDFPDSKGNTPLHLAARRGYYKAVCQLLAATPGRDITNHLGHTSLHLAADRGYSAIISVLLKHGFRSDMRNNQGQTPLHLATKSCRFEAVRETLAAITEPDATDIFGYTALHLAADKGLVEITKSLLINGADPNFRSSKNGSTALHFATQRNRIECIDLLLASGARMNIINNCGFTPLAIAKKNKFAPIVHKLTDPPPRRLQPQSLQGICRAAIRSRLVATWPRQPISASINRLDCLPWTMKDYLYSPIAL